MGMAITLREFLDNEGISYELLEHPYSSTCMEAAEAAHIPGNQLAKSVVLGDEKGYVLAVVPSTHKIDLSALQRYLGRRLELVTETELYKLFHDCDIGAVPPIGKAYGYETILDDSLMDCEDIYFEAGDHTDLVHISGKQFKTLMGEAEHWHFSSHV